MEKSGDADVEGAVAVKRPNKQRRMESRTFKSSKFSNNEQPNRSVSNRECRTKVRAAGL